MGNKGEKDKKIPIRKMLEDLNNLQNPSNVKNETKDKKRRYEFLNAIDDYNIISLIRLNVKSQKVSKEARTRVYSVTIQNVPKNVLVEGLDTVFSLQELCHGITYKKVTGEDRENFKSRYKVDEIESVWPALNLANQNNNNDDGLYVLTFGNKSKNIGIFSSENPPEIKGFKIFSHVKARSQKEAEDIVKMFKKENSELIVVDFQKNNQCNLYIDGSFRKEDNSFSYGFLILKNKDKIIEGSRRIYSHPWGKYRNVAGELSGAREGIRAAIEHGFNSINVYYDFDGIETYVETTNGFSKDNYLADYYTTEIDKFKEMASINFIKIKSHSGDKFNDYVDKLAKNA